MVSNTLRGLAAALSCASLATLAQTAPQRARPDPLDPAASVPALIYRSSLPLVREREADKAITWREANELVTRIGGWRSYAREAQAGSAPPASMSPAASVRPADSAAALPSLSPRPAIQQQPAPTGHGAHKSP
jgi:hypothetical protein